MTLGRLTACCYAGAMTLNDGVPGTALVGSCARLSAAAETAETACRCCCSRVCRVEVGFDYIVCAELGAGGGRAQSSGVTPQDARALSSQPKGSQGEPVARQRSDQNGGALGAREKESAGGAGEA